MKLCRLQRYNICEIISDLQSVCWINKNSATQQHLRFELSLRFIVLSTVMLQVTQQAVHNCSVHQSLVVVIKTSSFLINLVGLTAQRGLCWMFVYVGVSIIKPCLIVEP